MFIESCEKVCAIQNKDIFEIKEIAIIPFEKEKNGLED
jgi:hypothetical protein